MTSIIGFTHPGGKRSWAHGYYGPALTDPEKSNRVGLIVEVPDMEAFQKFMQSEAAVAAMKSDGVRPGTLLMLEKASGRM